MSPCGTRAAKTNQGLLTLQPPLMSPCPVLRHSRPTKKYAAPLHATPRPFPVSSPRESAARSKRRLPPPPSALKRFSSSTFGRNALSLSVSLALWSARAASPFISPGGRSRIIQRRAVCPQPASQAPTCGHPPVEIEEDAVEKQTSFGREIPPMKKGIMITDRGHTKLARAGLRERHNSQTGRREAKKPSLKLGRFFTRHPRRLPSTKGPPAGHGQVAAEKSL